ncbi:hydroxyproline O-galactosyltransferase GALT3 [Amborella trichopoda]|uniref:Galectin domain-containing protein n=1 Tax=Amborella trichopoda TaxID=13333 RepID=W1P6Q1_AMBTC|nr:hydroxyproline O-galactosyltransferase GALT3 [Amborella trichopoda]XP_020521144.1 hydroxyproline O-galactosyltransferase GALT3 [Amborella trichopoda]ERN03256.1 hypothetical protein AMTR_s00003p00196180 [Amborella trichopoda]|eukprot:XP_006841581.1 hydroxyproline O-galactosyltransferase GALT3 [Amborella trichopoda]
MKKWTGGTLIVILALVLVLRYSLMESPPQNDSPSTFFKNLSKESPPMKAHNIDNRSKPMERVSHAKKPHIVNLEGIDYLFSSDNISEKESMVKITWAQMRYLISRSDALPGTAEGVKEAAIAWKDLVATIEEDKLSKIVNGSKVRNGSYDSSCPFSIAATDVSESQTRTLFQIPCGLVQDSSITVVGIPIGLLNFKIQLIGLKASDGPDPPVILDYNVHLQGDNLTEEPVIIQNTWSSILKLGKEERCPAPASSNNVKDKVDGLGPCNEQVGRISTQEKSSGKQPHIPKWFNASRGSTDRKFSFPFVEGHPFTATLWVGMEGFHMTVDGKHVTSFPYRESLEPWLVSGVRLAGDLRLLSALANGLPISEDIALVPDLEKLKAPPLSKKRLVMLAGVFSTGNNFERRMAIRRSWMLYDAIRSGNVAVRFFVGLHKNKQVNIELWEEAQTYGDIQLMPFVDYYSLITLKTIALCIFGTKILQAKYIMKTDDDAFVRIDEVLHSLREKKVTQGLLYGLISMDSEPHRNKDSKWYISTEEWPHAKYPPWAHGPGYIISRDIAKFIVQRHQSRNLNLFKLEDVAMGIWIEEFKKSGQEVNYINNLQFRNAGCESDYILAHYQGPRLMLCLWQKLQQEHQPVCCE